MCKRQQQVSILTWRLDTRRIRGEWDHGLQSHLMHCIYFYFITFSLKTSDKNRPVGFIHPNLHVCFQAATAVRLFAPCLQKSQLSKAVVGYIFSKGQKLLRQVEQKGTLWLRPLFTQRSIRGKFLNTLICFPRWHLIWSFKATFFVFFQQARKTLLLLSSFFGISRHFQAVQRK